VDQLEAHAAAQGKPITIEYCLHEAFKARSHQSKAIVRSGEVTPTPTLFSAPVWRFKFFRKQL
jgi:D-ribose pyranase